MDEKRIAEMMKKLDLSREEVLEMMEYDDEVEHAGKKRLEHDLTEEQEKTAKKYTQTTATKKPMVLGKAKRERKPDEEKEAIIADLAQFLGKNVAESVEITNKSREIVFKVGKSTYKMQISRNREPKK